MEIVQPEEGPRASTVVERLAKLERQSQEEELKQAGKKEKGFNFPFKWQFKFRQANSVKNTDKVLLMMFNKKNQIEPPKFVRIIDNFIVYHDKVYKYNPADIWTMLVKGKPQVYAIKEIDMEPISNRDIEEIRKRGSSTENHKLLLKAAINANVTKASKPINWTVGIIIAVVVVGGLIWFFFSKG